MRGELSENLVAFYVASPCHTLEAIVAGLGFWSRLWLLLAPSLQVSKAISLELN